MDPRVHCDILNNVTESQPRSNPTTAVCRRFEAKSEDSTWAGMGEV